MHTTVVRAEHPDAPYNEVDYVCNHNGDYSGAVWVTVALEDVHNRAADVDGHPSGLHFERTETVMSLEEWEPRVVQAPATETVQIPFEVMKALVARWARDEMISELEQMDDEEILKRVFR